MVHYPQFTNDSVNKEMKNKYKIMDKKINKLVHNQMNKPDENMKFYSRVFNQTDITFSNEELAVLNKGLKYNLSNKCKQWIRGHYLLCNPRIRKMCG
jgi:hypothetical protein